MIASTFFISRIDSPWIVSSGFRGRKNGDRYLLPHLGAEGVDLAGGFVEVVRVQAVLDERGEVAPFAVEAAAVLGLVRVVLVLDRDELLGNGVAREHVVL